MILAYLPPRLLRHLQYILGPDQPPVVARNWGEIGELVEANPVSVAIIDPSSDGQPKAIELQQLMVAYPSLPTIAYVPLTPQAFTTITQLAQTGLRHVVLYSHDDGAQRFLSLIDQARTSPITIKVIDRLRPRIVMLPLRLGKALETLFAEPHRYPSAQHLATISMIPLVRVYRAFHETGFATPKTVFKAAKMLKAYSYLGDPGHSVTSAAKKVGYRNTRIFAEHCADVFDINPSRLHTYMTEDQAIEKVMRSLEIVRDDECKVAAYLTQIAAERQ